MLPAGPLNPWHDLKRFHTPPNPSHVNPRPLKSSLWPPLNPFHALNPPISLSAPPTPPSPSPYRGSQLENHRSNLSIFIALCTVPLLLRMLVWMIDYTECILNIMPYYNCICVYNVCVYTCLRIITMCFVSSFSLVTIKYIDLKSCRYFSNGISCFHYTLSKSPSSVIYTIRRHLSWTPPPQLS